jgi:hypothetical protein
VNCSPALKGSTPHNNQGSQSTQDSLFGWPKCYPSFWSFLVYIVDGYNNHPSLVSPHPRRHAQHDARVAEDSGVKQAHDTSTLCAVTTTRGQNMPLAHHDAHSKIRSSSEVLTKAKYSHAKTLYSVPSFLSFYVSFFCLFCFTFYCHFSFYYLLFPFFSTLVFVSVFMFLPQLRIIWLVVVVSLPTDTGISDHAYFLVDFFSWSVILLY